MHFFFKKLEIIFEVTKAGACKLISFTIQRDS